jgi:hypothetical protein
MRLALATLMGLLALQACEVEEASREGDPKFPLEPHYLLPQYTAANGQIAAGVVTGKTAALEQPIPFSHNIHAGMLGMDCEFCHNEARNSIHAGVPPVQMCMNCHQHVKTDNPDVLKIHAHYCEEPPCTVESGPFGPIAPDFAHPIEWQKVHDLPDYVYFSHKRHVRGGVQCTECHGQVQLQGKKEVVFENGVQVEKVQTVMVRESTLQMGWCLNCHADHPSIDKNYGEQADLRRAELKDCWTCHR